MILNMKLAVAFVVFLLSTVTGDEKDNSRVNFCYKRKPTLLFDAFGTLLDFSSLTTMVSEVTHDPENFIKLWRQKQVEYSWLRSLMRRYVPFWNVTSDALDYTLQRTETSIDGVSRDRLMDAWLHLKPFPEVRSALQAMSFCGLSVLSNGDPYMLRESFANAGLSDLIDPIISVDSVSIYKPDPSVYELAADVLKLSKRKILFVSSNGWDASGAKSYGFPTVWVNRDNAPLELLGVKPDLVVSNVSKLKSYAHFFCN